jgi:hypothetical protein
MKNLITLFCFLLTSTAWSVNWADLSVEDQAEILYDLSYYVDFDEAEDVEIYKVNVDNLTLYSDYKGKYESYISKLLNTFINKVDTEAIDQSPYLTSGEPEVTSITLLVNLNDEVVGAEIRVYQEGTFEDGEESDINWTASLRADKNAQVLRDENGNPFDDLYFEWSGF